MPGSRKSGSRSRKSSSRKSSRAPSSKNAKVRNTGKGSKRPQPGGQLGPYGYSAKHSVEQRRRALREAVNDLGVKKIRQILNLIRNYNKNNDSYDRMNSDMEWLKGQSD